MTALEQLLGRMASHGLGYLLVWGVPAIMALATLPLYTHYLDPGDFGALAWAMATVALLTSVAAVWLNTAAVRFHPHSRGESPAADSTFTSTIACGSIAAATVVAGLGALGLLLFGDRLTPAIAELLPLALVLVWLRAPQQVGLSVLRGGQRVRAFSRLSLASHLVAVALSVALVVAAYGAAGVLVGRIVGTAVVMPPLIAGLRRGGPIAWRALSGERLRQFARYGVPLAGANLAYWTLSLSDRWIIDAYRGGDELGVYALSYELADQCTQLALVPFTMAMTPIVVSAFERDGAATAQRLITQLTRFYVLLALPLVVGLGVVAQPLVEVLARRPIYHDGAWLVPWIAAGVFCYGLTSLAANGLYLRCRSHVMLLGTAFAAALNVGLNLWLVPQHGYAAAAFTTLAAYLALLAFTAVAARQALRWRPPWSDLGRIALATAVMALAVDAAGRALPTSIAGLAARCAVGVGVYAIALRAVRALRVEERSALARWLPWHRGDRGAAHQAGPASGR